MMQKLIARLMSLRLQNILVVGFALITAITMVVATPITYSVINNYLEVTQNERIGRDMDLADAFYNIKLEDISSTAQEVATAPCLQEMLAAANGQPTLDPQSVEREIDRELDVLPPETQRFIVAIGSPGTTLTGRVLINKTMRTISPAGDWSSLPIVQDVLATGQVQAATEVIPVAVLESVGLEGQARIDLLDTPKAAPEPFDLREGTAGLALVGVAPVWSQDSGSGEVVGAVLVGHLLNSDFTLVDRIKEVAGVDTVTIFFGDLRVSTNVLDEAGNRAIGTRVSEEVRDVVLAQGREFTGPAYVVNQWYITRYRPLYDHRGQVVGSLYVGAKQAAFQRLVDSFRSQVVLIAGATMLLAVLVAIPMSRLISRPLAELAKAAREVAQGDWSVRLPVYGHGEMGILAASFNKMVETLERSFKSILEALQDTQQQLVQKEKLASVGQLAAGVAHEINNPLGTVLLYADILLKETPEESEQSRADLQRIIGEAERCKSIVTDLLNFARQNEVLAQETDLNRLLQELMEDEQRQEAFEGIQVIMELATDLPTTQADPLQLRQVFANLIRNAAEAMNGKGTLTLVTRPGPGNDHVTVEVHDTGCGIPEENISKLFTPFFTTKPIGKGTGLGLAIVYGIVKMHRGQIFVSSKVGEGTLFTVTLPRRLPDQPVRQSDSSELIG